MVTRLTVLLLLLLAALVSFQPSPSQADTGGQVCVTLAHVTGTDC
jgi:hypothetical protein